MAAVLNKMSEPVPKIDFMQTISRVLTHKRRIENVYVTSMDRISENEFLCGAYVPHANFYLNGMRFGPNDVALTIIETARQAGIALCHAYLGVGTANIFILNSMRFETFPAYHEIDWLAHDALAIRASYHDQILRADGTLGAAHTVFDFRNGDVTVGRLHTECAIHSVKSGHRLREIAKIRNLRHASASTDAQPFFEGMKVAPVCSVKQSLLHSDLWVEQSGKKFAATLQIDLDNLFFFDHENDHVPGMLILEGMRELAADAAMRFPRKHEGQPRISGIDVNFTQFAELDYPIVLVAEIEQGDGANQETCIRVQGRQFDKVVAEGSFVIG